MFAFKNCKRVSNSSSNTSNNSPTDQLFEVEHADQLQLIHIQVDPSDTPSDHIGDLEDTNTSQLSNKWDVEPSSSHSNEINQEPNTLRRRRNTTAQSDEEEEWIRYSQIDRKKEFCHLERIDGRVQNVLQGLELHTSVFNDEEQKKIVEYVYSIQRTGQNGQLRERTYSEPRKWMRGKGRVTIQFGCCYNYAVDRNGNPPGIVREEEVDPLPPLFKQMIKRMVRWHILPPTCIPNSCIVNIYDEGDCIPPHIDHHDFLRPFCTVSLLTECNILFGSNLNILSPGEFSGPVSIPLPVGSVLILNGNGADIAKHCVPAVPAKRISITFRTMDDSKLPYEFSPDPELMGIKPMVYSPLNKSYIQQNRDHKPRAHSPFANSPFQQNRHQNGKLPLDEIRSPKKAAYGNSFIRENDDFPPLGSSSSNSGNRVRFTRR